MFADSVCAPIQVMVNLNPSHPELGEIKSRLPSMHGVSKDDCKCDKASITELRINHYLGSTGDFVDKTRRYWQVCACEGPL